MKNCRDYCPYTQICARHYPDCKGEEGLSHSDCPIAWKIEDLIMDGEYAMKEQEPDEEIPFCEDYDGPEEVDLL